MSRPAARTADRSAAPEGRLRQDPEPQETPALRKSRSRAGFPQEARVGPSSAAPFATLDAAAPARLGLHQAERIPETASPATEAALTGPDERAGLVKRHGRDVRAEVP